MLDKVSALTPQPPNPRDPARIHDAAQQFEALLVAQMLKASRESTDGGWMGSGDDQTAESAIGIAEEHLGQAIAAGGGLGLARSIVSGLAKESGSGGTPAHAPLPMPALPR